MTKPKLKKSEEDGNYDPECDSESSGSSNEFVTYAGRTARKDYRKFPMECEECDEIIESRKDHYRHYQLYHQDIEYPYSLKSNFVCQQCGAMRRTINNLKIHEKIHGEKNIECEECGKKFHSKHQLRRHQVFHKEYNFKCDYCKKGFHHKADLTLHLRTHTGEKPFECHICGARFAHKGNVGIHMRAKHQQAARHASKKPKKKTQGEEKGKKTITSNVRAVKKKK